MVNFAGTEKSELNSLMFDEKNIFEDKFDQKFTWKLSKRRNFIARKLRKRNNFINLKLIMKGIFVT